MKTLLKSSIYVLITLLSITLMSSCTNDSFEEIVENQEQVTSQKEGKEIQTKRQPPPTGPCWTVQILVNKHPFCDVGMGDWESVQTIVYSQNLCESTKNGLISDAEAMGYCVLESAPSCFRNWECALDM